VNELMHRFSVSMTTKSNFISASTRCGILSCDYRCHSTPDGGACYCGQGMQVAADGISCEGNQRQLVATMIE